MNARIAIPSTHPGGLEAQVGAHFGHCECYTLVEVKAGAIENVETHPSVPHAQGGCLAPVNYLAEKGVNMLISGGMGLRPLMGFNQVGIEVYRGVELPNVGEAVKALINGQLDRFSKEFTCGGGK